MFDEKYKSLFENINGNERHKEKLREILQKEQTEMDKHIGKERKYSSKAVRYTAAAAVLFITSFALFKILGDGGVKNPIAENPTPPAVVETPEENTVLYSSLDFAESGVVSAPVALNDFGGKIAAFTENILSEGSAVIKGTVTDIRFKEYNYMIGSEESEGRETQAVRQSVIYEIKVDRIFYSDGSFSEGETIIIENDLYTYTSLASSVEKLKTNRQYILALYENDGEVYIPADTEVLESTQKLESSLSVLYPFTTQIEITADGKYIFPDHWVSLVNEETKTVTMDIEEGFGYYGEMKLREDENFESDFQSLVDTYLGK